MIEVCDRECGLTEISDRMGDAGGEDEVVRLWRRYDPPHPVDDVGRIAPVALRRARPERDLFLQPPGDAGGRPHNLSSHVVLAAARAFVVEEDPRARKESV